MIRRRVHRSLCLAAVLATAACTPPGLPAPITPTSSPTQPTAPSSEGALIIGMDGSPSGFNLHAIADFSPVSTAVSSLVLPSASVSAPDGTLTINHDLLVSAVVTSKDPFTVSYTVNRDASWSDGTPITAEDFSYLRDQMVAQPGTVDPAGYRLITAIRSLDAGKKVQVEFSATLPDWLTLFSPLLPSHILKDSPGGWADGLTAGIPVSGNRYKMSDIDNTTGQITLIRNDKYWGRQPGRATVILRIGSADGLVGALAHGDVQAVVIRPGVSATADPLAAVPASRRSVVALPETAQLVFNTSGGPTAELAVRRAIAAGLDLTDLRSELGGGRQGGVRTVNSQLTLPTDSESSAVPVTTGNPGAAAAALTAAGYSKGGVYVRRNGAVLRISLAYPANDTRVAATAELIQRELGDVGIEVDLVKLASRTLVNDRLAAGTAQLALVMVPRTHSDRISAASAFSCPAPAATPGGGTGIGAPPAPLLRLGNLSGYCNAGVDVLLSAGLLGRITTAQQITVDSRLWADLPVLPVGQPTELFAVGSALSSVIGSGGPGWTFSGPLIGVPGWP